MLRRYQSADVLPEEGLGFEREEDEGEEFDEGAQFCFERSGLIPSATGEFNFEFMESCADYGASLAVLYGKMTSAADGTLVGVLSGDLVDRDIHMGSGILSVCDARSAELIDLARSLIKDDGSLRPFLKHAIGDAQRIAAAGSGGLLFLEEVHILRSYRGRDLSLQFVDALLRFLAREPSRWSLLITTVVPYDFEDQKRRRLRQPPAPSAARIPLCRQFARLGLQQVGRFNAWYLEQSQMPSQPRTRAEVADLSVWVAPDPDPEIELDAKLIAAIHGVTKGYPFAHISTILVHGGSARIQATCALHHAVYAARIEVATAERVCRMLLRANADINQKDVGGRTPLHVLAKLPVSLGSPRAIQFLGFLLEHGADPLALTPEGATPLDHHISSTTSQLESTIGLQASFGQVLPQLEIYAEGHLAASVMLRRATAARRKQFDEREVLVKCLMYHRGLCSDILRKIHAAVAPPPMSDYRPLGRDLPDGTHVVLGVMEDRRLSGVLGAIVGWDASTLQYEISPRDDDVGPDIVLVKPERVLPLSREITVPQ